MFAAIQGKQRNKCGNFFVLSVTGDLKINLMKMILRYYALPPALSQLDGM